MAFNPEAFMAAKLSARTKTVSVPVLAEWFDDKEEPTEWTVRGLTANELARVNEAEVRNKREGALLEALSDGTRSEMVAEMQRALGRTKDTRPDLARRLEMLSLASVEPECSEELAVKLSGTFPTQFWELTNAILELTGRGSEVEKKQVRSGEKQKSEHA